LKYKSIKVERNRMRPQGLDIDLFDTFSIHPEIAYPSADVPESLHDNIEVPQYIQIDNLIHLFEPSDENIEVPQYIQIDNLIHLFEPSDENIEAMYLNH